MMTNHPTALTLSKEVEALLYREARLLDDLQLTEWLDLFTEDGLYWIPMDENAPVARAASLVYDDRMRREERVHHLQHLPFPAQSPRSRTVHLVSNIEIENAGGDSIDVRSAQVIYEVRTGDFTQIGLGQVRPLVARAQHVLRRVDGQLKISLKKLLLIDRDMPQANLTFII